MSLFSLIFLLLPSCLSSSPVSAVGKETPVKELAAPAGCKEAPIEVANSHVNSYRAHLYGR
uniref:Uncharacterized protein n=1 Tax=Cucumis melo TaxID=3656 RepID=A0A9I9CZ02_CUCME